VVAGFAYAEDQTMGASLLAMAVSQATSMLDVPGLIASKLAPTGFVALIMHS
jgi:hypothetical protein